MGEAEALGRFVYGTVLVLYWGTALVCLYLGWSRPKSPRRRATYIVLVVTIFGYVPAMGAYADWQAQRYKHAAYAHFTKRCNENAGEKINRVVEDVEGLFIARPRAVASVRSLQDQYWNGDPYGYSDLEAHHPAGTYLYDRSGKTVSQRVLTPIKGFAIVEMANPAHIQGRAIPRYLRYTLQRLSAKDADGNSETRIEPVAEAVDELRARYAITWEDISTPEDRRYWVAGGTLTIFDISSGEVIAQRTGYVIDPQLGRMTRGRQIWLHVNHIPGAFCPAFENDFHKNKEFVAKVLRPISGGSNVQ